MADDTDLRRLKENISKLQDEQLVEMVTTAASEYRQEALDYAKAELTSRGIDWDEPVLDEEDETAALTSDAGPKRSQLPAGSAGSCVCGGKLRIGTLVGEKEMTIVFNDNREERFVLVTACAQCGQVSLLVDYETELEK